MDHKKLCTSREPDLSSAAAEKVGGNGDLLSQILLKVPARSLKRFKSVSEQWRSLISDDNFCRHHFRRHGNSLIPSGLHFYNCLTNSEQLEAVSLNPQNIHNHSSRVSDRVPFFPFPLSKDLLVRSGIKIRILQASNGLYLCSYFVVSNPVMNGYCVSNPTTNKCETVPPPNNPSVLDVVGCSLAFDPLTSPHYKVVCVQKLNGFLASHFHCQIQIYSSENQKWEATECRFVTGCGLVVDSGIYCNGSVYWIVQDGARNVYGFQFDVNAEKLTRMILPSKPQSKCNYTFRYFGAYNGSLHLVYVRSRSAKKFNVIEIDRDTLTWSVKYRVHICHLITEFPEIVVQKNQAETAQYAFQILCVVKGEGEEDSALVLAIPGKVISYNFMSKTSKVLSTEITSQVDDNLHFQYASAYQFIETLYPFEHAFRLEK